MTVMNQRMVLFLRGVSAVGSLLSFFFVVHSFIASPYRELPSMRAGRKQSISR